MTAPSEQYIAKQCACWQPPSLYALESIHCFLELRHALPNLHLPSEMPALRTTSAFAARNNVYMWQYDRKTGFLCLDLCQELCIEHHEGLEMGIPRTMLRLLKSIHSMKNARWPWNLQWWHVSIKPGSKYAQLLRSCFLLLHDGTQHVLSVLMTA